MPLLELRNVSKAYRQGGAWKKGETVQAVRNVTLGIEAGECLAVVGPSGSGKSTLGRLALGLEKPDLGTVLYKGYSLSILQREMKRRARRDLQVVFQNSLGAVNPRFTAHDIVAEPLVNFDRLKGTRLRHRVGQLLEMVGLDPAEMDKLPHQFSGGELQRICLARSLAPSPALIVLDEAVSSLDMLSQSLVLQVLARVKKETGAAFLFISHDLRVVGKVADSLAIVKQGQLALYCTNVHDEAERSALQAAPAYTELASALLPARPACRLNRSQHDAQQSTR